MNDKYIFNINPLKKTQIECVLFESYYPVLFTARNDKKDLFLCVCCLAENNIKKWLVTKVEEMTIVDMLRDKITIRESFLKNPRHRYTVMSNAGNLTITFNDTDDWDAQNSRYLPTAGEYMDSSENEFKEEINFYSKHVMPISNPQIKITLKAVNLVSDWLTPIEFSRERYNDVYCENIIFPPRNKNIVYRKSIQRVLNEYSLQAEDTVNDLSLAS